MFNVQLGIRSQIQNLTLQSELFTIVWPMDEVDCTMVSNVSRPSKTKGKKDITSKGMTCI